MNNGNPTLSSIKKVLAIFENEKKLISKNYICENYNLHPYAVTSILDFLIKENKIEKVKTSSKGGFYKIKNGNQ